MAIKKVCSVTADISEAEQERCFMNATLQGNKKISFSIATHVEVPDDVYDKGQKEVVQYLKDVLGMLAIAAPMVTYEVQVGPARGAEEVE